MGTLPDSVTDRIDRGDDVLVLCPSFAGEESAACIDLLTVEEPERRDVLSVTFTQSADDRLAVWERHVDTLPARAGIVSVAADTRSTAGVVATDDGVSSGPDASVTVDTVSSPDNLTELGVRITERLEEWRPAPSNRRTVLCFHSLTTLLQYVPLERAFEFLHVLTGRPVTEDATAHYHLDPVAHDPETVATLAELFDVVCEFDGEWRVSRRQTDPETGPAADRGAIDP